jgi:hypothetical protein
MNCEVIRIISKTERKVWHFTLMSNIGQPKFWLNSFSLESKQPKQRIWRTVLHWNRLDQRDNTIKEPPLPEDVIQDAKTLIKTQIDMLPITQ